MSNNINSLQQKASVEIRSTVVRSGTPRIVPYADRYNYTGFTSMYGYLEDAVKEIRRTGSTRNFKRFPVFSDTLFVDFDNQDEAADDFRGLLESLEIRFDRYHSGGRSIHFHIPIEPMYGLNVPASQRYWMEKNAPLADMSIYKHAGLYRLPGTYHAKYPGNKKKLLDSSEGNKLVIENRPIIKVSMDNDDNEVSPQEAYMILGKLLHTEAAEGNRHPHAFKIVRACKASNQPESEAFLLLDMWNSDNCYPPKQDWELSKLVRWVYGDT